MEIIKKILQIFLWNFTDIVKKIWRNVGNTSYKFFNISMEFCHISLSIFGKIYEKLLEKYKKYFMVSISFKNTVYHSMHHDCAKYFPISLLIGMWRLKSKGYQVIKKKSIVSKMITKIINDLVISSSPFKIVKIYHNYIFHQRFSF